MVTARVRERQRLDRSCAQALVGPELTSRYYSGFRFTASAVEAGTPYQDADPNQYAHPTVRRQRRRGAVRLTPLVDDPDTSTCRDAPCSTMSP
jgi:hypothetical protein